MPIHTHAYPYACAQVTEQSTSRTSPLFAARRGDHTEVAAILERAGAVEIAEMSSPEEAEEAEEAEESKAKAKAKGEGQLV